jgi:VCBS repeat-containing protein
MITIHGENAAPIAADDGGSGFSTGEGTPFTTASVLTNDSDPDGDSLSIIGYDDSDTQGLVRSNGDGTFDYDPDGRFEFLQLSETAVDSFTYTVTDGNGGYATAQVTITIIGVNFRVFLPLVEAR